MDAKVLEHMSVVLKHPEFFKKLGQPRPLFRLFSFFSNKHHHNLNNTSMWKKFMSIQYTALGFKPSTFRMWASSHNHLARAPIILFLRNIDYLFPSLHLRASNCFKFWIEPWRTSYHLLDKEAHFRYLGWRIPCSIKREDN